LGVYNILGLNWWQQEATVAVCKMAEGFCEGIIEAIAGEGMTEDNWSRLSEFL